jgi:hypothetical protein
MFTLKALAPGAVPEALEKARDYRLHNEPVEAESICLDVLEVEPDNQQAVRLLILALTDQFEKGGAAAFDRARKALARVEGEYERAYYAGIICERQAKTVLRARGRRSGAISWEWFRRALDHYEVALAKRPAGDVDATLRWNTCVRIMERHPHCALDTSEHIELGLE